jgi:streptomycin 6-kinase
VSAEPRSPAATTTANARLDQLARQWQVRIEAVRETATSTVAFGVRGHERVAIKVVRIECDEWNSGEVLAAFGGGRFARALEHAPGAVLMERLEPGLALSDLVRNGRDDEATDIIASIAAQHPAHAPPARTPSAERWIGSFRRYALSDDQQIERTLVAAGLRHYEELCRTQTSCRLLHGDLQHYNVLSSARGWVAIDPKGVLAEAAFEAGAFLRNPHGSPELMRDEHIVKRRAERFARRLDLDVGRVLAWGFTQAVLSLIWSREDGERIAPDNPSLALARTLLPHFA